VGTGDPGGVRKGGRLEQTDEKWGKKEGVQKISRRGGWGHMRGPQNGGGRPKGGK